MQEKKSSKLKTQATYIQAATVDSRDFYESIPNFTVQKIVADLDKESSFGSIEDLLRSQNTKDSTDSRGNSKTILNKQLAKLESTLKKVEIESAALIASFTK